MELKDKLRKLRKEKGWTQLEVAEKLDPPHSYAAVTMWETGRAKPRIDTLSQLARLFDTSVAELLGEVGQGLEGSSAFLPLRYAASMTDFSADADPDRLVEVPKSVVDHHPRAYAVHGHGRCMDRRLPEDCVLVVDPDLPPRDGEVVLFENSDCQHEVRLYRAGSSTLLLVADSFSGEYDDIIVRPSDPPVKVLGVVVWYQASEDVRYG